MKYQHLAVLLQQKALADRKRGCEQDMEYYICDALGRLNALHERQQERLLVLATKHCPKWHHDWDEIFRIYARAAGAELPPEPNTPSYTELYRIIRNAMTSHQDWEHLVEGTPLENDLPVRATVAAYERYSK